MFSWCWSLQITESYYWTTAHISVNYFIFFCGVKLGCESSKGTISPCCMVCFPIHVQIKLSFESPSAVWWHTLAEDQEAVLTHEIHMEHRQDGSYLSSFGLPGTDHGHFLQKLCKITDCPFGVPLWYLRGSRLFHQFLQPQQLVRGDLLLSHWCHWDKHSNMFSWWAVFLKQISHRKLFK